MHQHRLLIPPPMPVQRPELNVDASSGGPARSNTNCSGCKLTRFYGSIEEFVSSLTAHVTNEIISAQ